MWYILVDLGYLFLIKISLSSANCLDLLLILQIEEEVALTLPPTIASTSKQSKRGEQQLIAFTASPSSDDAEPSHRRSKCLAKLPAKCKNRNYASKNKRKKQKQAASSSGQRQLGQSKHNDSQLEPQDIVRHYNGLYSRDFGQLSSDSPHRPSDMDMNPSSDLQTHIDPATESPLHSSSYLHAQQDASSESHLDPSSNLQPDPVPDPHPNLSLDHHTEQVDTVSDDEGDETYVGEPYSSQSEPESAGLQTQGSGKGSGATAGRNLKKKRRTV